MDYPSLRSYYQQLEPDVIHTIVFMNNIYTIACIFLTKLRAPLIIIASATPAESIRTSVAQPQRVGIKEGRGSF